LAEQSTEQQTGAPEALSRIYSSYSTPSQLNEILPWLDDTTIKLAWLGTHSSSGRPESKRMLYYCWQKELKLLWNTVYQEFSITPMKRCS